jgi:hypothetical protein
LAAADAHFAFRWTLPGDILIMRSIRRRTVARVLARVVGLASFVATSAAAQSETCGPVAQRAGREFGCFITAREELGALPKDSALYWHIDAFTAQAAAEAAQAPRSTVVRSLGRIWLFTIAERGWRPASGQRIAVVGPLPLVDADAYAAVYMEGVFKPECTPRPTGIRGWRPGIPWRASNAWRLHKASSNSGQELRVSWCEAECR